MLPEGEGLKREGPYPIALETKGENGRSTYSNNSLTYKSETQKKSVKDKNDESDEQDQNKDGDKNKKMWAEILRGR